MESETILTPASPSLAVFLFPSEPNIPEGQKYEKKYQHFIDAWEEVLPNPRRNNDRSLRKDGSQDSHNLHMIFV